MDDLVEFLRARLNADEKLAREAASLQLDPENGWGIDGRAITPHIAVVHEDQPRQHIARHNPARVLAEVEAKRLIVDECAVTIKRRDIDDGLASIVLRALAEPYADHPDYDERWTA